MDSETIRERNCRTALANRAHITGEDPDSLEAFYRDDDTIVVRPREA